MGTLRPTSYPLSLTTKLISIRMANTGVDNVSTVGGNKVTKTVSKKTKKTQLFRTTHSVLPELPSPPQTQSQVSSVIQVSSSCTVCVPVQQPVVFITLKPLF